MSASFDSDAAIAIEFGSQCGLQDVIVVSCIPSEDGRKVFEIAGFLSVDTSDALPEEAQTLSEFLADRFHLRVFVYEGKVTKHEWVGVQFS